jgi:hypothetical protein
MRMIPISPKRRIRLAAEVETELQTKTSEDFFVDFAEEEEQPLEPVEPATEVEAELQTELAEEEYDADLVEEEEGQPFEPVEPAVEAETEI